MLAVRERRRRARETRERSRVHGLLEMERGMWERGIRHVAGVDEAGRGPLAGPVVAAAVILPQDCDLRGVDDSKKLSAQKREALFDVIRQEAVAVGVGRVDHEEIDRLNILEGTLEAMRRAVRDLGVRPDCVLVDGTHLPHCGCSERAIVDGDARSLSIAAASVIAKVTRDREMVALDAQHPGYGFADHKGYGTAQHLAALKRLGPCPVHRRSFRPVEEARRRGSDDFEVFREGIGQAGTPGALEGIGRAIGAASGALARDELVQLRRLYRERREALRLPSRGHSRQTGARGEEAASRHLVRKGFQIVERNYRSGRGEIDLIARKAGLLVFVEVKTGREGQFGPPETWVDAHKQKQIIQTARAYLQEHPAQDTDFRFDVVAIDAQQGTTKHIEGAFRAEA